MSSEVLRAAEGQKIGGNPNPRREREKPNVEFVEGEERRSSHEPFSRDMMDREHEER